MFLYSISVLILSIQSTLCMNPLNPPSSKTIQLALDQMVNDEECTSAWPNVTHCVNWWVDTSDNLRYCLTNSIPPYPVEPYCPFGVGKGYCMTGVNHDECDQFKGLECPAQEGAPATGDVVVPIITLFAVPSDPNPTSSQKPLYVYRENPLLWYYGPTVNSMTNATTMNKKRHNRHLLQQPVGPGGGTIGVHIAGQDIKGPEEAEGVNIDLSGIPLVCGGHVTPPVGLGPQYHFHKASTCLMDDMADIEYIPHSASSHSDLVAYANDGFGIYGFYDLKGRKPVIDECNGHFGCLDDECTDVQYHYHTQNFTYGGTGEQFEPYWIGCLGPSKGLCNTTIPAQDTTPKCGSGCGYEICVQPNTDKDALNDYIASFGNANWLDQFTVNPY